MKTCYNGLRILIVPGIFVFFIYACNTPKTGLFRQQSPHQKYAASLESAGLRQTVLGQTWMQAAEKSLRSPFTVSLPYQETGYFPAELPSATGLRFAARRGEQLVINISPQPKVSIFAELWIQDETEHKLVAVVDSGTHEWIFEVEKMETINSGYNLNCCKL